MTTQTNFLGIPVAGEIQHVDPDIPQRPLADLEPILRDLLDDPSIAAFGWTQYTPYFNDGEPCVFRVHEPWFRTPNDSEDLDRYELEIDSHPTLGTRRWNGTAKKFEPVERSTAVLETRDHCSAFAGALESGAFNRVLLEAFGDHAEVKITRDGITVDSYEHD